MADTNANLNVRVKATDEASPVLRQVGTNMKDVGTSSDSLGSSLGAMAGKFELAAAAAATFMAYEIGDFLKDAAQSAIDEGATMAQVAVDVKNAGLSYQQLGPQLDAVAKKNESLGFTNDETSLSMGKLLLATGNYSQALRLNSLAMDLARAKGLDLNSATVLIQEVMAGNTRALKEYGISLDSASTSADALNILQSKLQGSTQAYASTAAGEIAEVEAQWDGIKDTVGAQLLPVVKDLFNDFESNLPEITSDLQQVANTFVDTVTIVEGLIGVGKELVPVFQNAVTIISDLLPPLKILEDDVQIIYSLADAVTKAKIAKQQAIDVTAQYTAKLQQLADAYNAVHTDQVTADDLSKTDADNTKKLTEAKADLAAQNTKTAGTFDDIADATSSAASDAASHLKDEQSAFRDYSKAIVSDIDDQAKSILKLQDQMTDLQGQLTDDLSKSNEQYQDDVVSLAQDAQSKVTDLDKQIADEQSTMSAGWRSRVADLQTQKNQELAIIAQAGTQVSDLNSKLNENDLQQLEDKHAQELQDIKDANNEKQLELQKEQLQDEATLLQDEVNAKNPNYKTNATAAVDSFLGAIGATTNQQQIVFNFNGGVAGDDGIKQIIMDTIDQLNRNAKLAGVGAK